jgi:hypothetical protein
MNNPQNKIEGGFYLKAKCIQNADIAHAPPHVREIWDWLLLKAMFKDGDVLKKGQVLTSYDEIRQGLSWNVGWRKMTYSKWDCEKAMKMLTKLEMITTKKTTKGMVITICKYSYYQDIINYESHTESHRKATGKPQTTDTIEKEVKEYIKKNKEKEYNIYGSQFQKVKLSEDEYQKLIVLFGEKGTTDRIENMDIYLESKGDKYKSHYATLLSWERKNNTGGSNGNGNGAGKFTQKTGGPGNSGTGQNTESAYPIDIDCNG